MGPPEFGLLLLQSQRPDCAKQYDMNKQEEIPDKGAQGLKGVMHHSQVSRCFCFMKVGRAQVRQLPGDSKLHTLGAKCNTIFPLRPFPRGTFER